MLETKEDEFLITSVHDFLVGSNVNRADDFKVMMQKLCKEYVVGSQHDTFLFMSHVISKLDEDILNLSKEEKYN